VSNLRLLGGTARGRALEVPESARPTGVRVRKSLFSLLEPHYGEGCTFLDLFAGSGSVGLEAASRGYDATLVELDRDALRALDKNLKNLRLQAKIVSSEAISFLARPPLWDMIFVDPPFDQDIAQIAKAAMKQHRLEEDGVCIVQHPSSLTLPEWNGYALEVREYGYNTLSLYWKESGNSHEPRT
jgi:16S rRNA (guanine966-N2)-methyltransferase